MNVSGMNTIIVDKKEKALTKDEWVLEERNGLVLVFSPLLNKYPNFVHAFTTRLGGQSKPPFDSFNVGINNTTDEETRKDARHNKALLCQALNLPFQHLITAKRLVHSADVVMLETHSDPGEVDGIATRTRLRPVYMTFADCVPMIVYDQAKHILCLIHAGWRGTAGGIGKEAVQFMMEKCDSKANDLVVAIGPAIGSCCYPVGVDVVVKLMASLISTDELLKMVEAVEAFKQPCSEQKDKLKNMTGKIWDLINKLNLTDFFKLGETQIHVDLKAINAYQLLDLNVSDVDITNFCTSCKKDLFYSYRRSYVCGEGPTGRQAAIACLV